ncbi:MAG: DapH/DapD/GlmU-related protein [Chloroflexota bacterium]
MYRASLPRLRLANLLCKFMPPLSLPTVRAAVYRGIKFDIGDRVSFFSSMTVIGAGSSIYDRLSIGEGSIIGLNPVFNLDARITIGRNVSLGPSVSIYTSTHMLGPASRRMQPEVVAKPVVIEEGTWVGAASIILPGVVIGRGCVVSAGSVVKTSIPPNTLVAGNPAVALNTLPLQDR